jgi:dTDP-4-amino-4,6-dideoxy-D-galactose acyltransferase
MSDLPELVRFLPWDSDFFGKRIARVIPTTLNQVDLDMIDAWGKENRIDCVYFLSESVGGAELTPVQKAGFRLMDLRVTFILHLNKTSDRAASDFSAIFPANLTDIPMLRDIAAQNHRDSRFYSDINFNRAISDALYATWIEKAVRDPKQKVFVYRQQGEPIGYVTYSIHESKYAEIGLVGISPTCQGKGIGFQLIEFSLQQMENDQLCHVTVVTQGKNVAALNLYEKTGFRILKIESWFHKWY